MSLLQIDRTKYEYAVTGKRGVKVNGFVGAETIVPVPCTNPAGPYSISHGPADEEVQFKIAEVPKGAAVSAVLTKHC